MPSQLHKPKSQQLSKWSRGYIAATWEESNTCICHGKIPLIYISSKCRKAITRCQKKLLTTAGYKYICSVYIECIDLVDAN